MSDRQALAYRRPGRPRSAEADAAIHRATLELITENGYGAATLDAIAERAGVGRATIYRRYQHKDQLAVAALESVIGTFETPDSGDTRTDFATLLCQIPPEAPNFARLLAAITTSPCSDQLLETLHRTRVKPRRHVLATVLQRGITKGDIRADLDIETFVDTAVGTVAWYLLAKPSTKLTPQLAKRIVDMLWQGAAPRPTTDAQR